MSVAKFKWDGNGDERAGGEGKIKCRSFLPYWDELMWMGVGWAMFRRQY